MHQQLQEQLQPPSQISFCSDGSSLNLFRERAFVEAQSQPQTTRRHYFHLETPITQPETLSHTRSGFLHLVNGPFMKIDFRSHISIHIVLISQLCLIGWVTVWHIYQFRILVSSLVNQNQLCDACSTYSVFNDWLLPNFTFSTLFTAECGTKINHQN